MAANEQRRISIAALKSFAAARLSNYPLTRSLILAEGDVISAEEFLAKILPWQRLLKMEKRMQCERR
jgi:hypothetical protein